MTFEKEIQRMMHGFGDCAFPLPESARIIESVVHRHMHRMIHQGLETAETRGSKIIAPEDLIFIIRNDHCLLQRLINYMGNRDFTLQSVTQNQQSNVDVIDLASESESSRKKTCILFLQSINHTGEYDAICNGALYDPIKIERTMRYDAVSQNMSATKYKEYCQSRRASFCPSMRVNKFREWLHTDDLADMELGNYVLEILNFCAHEIVAKMIDLALLVRRDKSKSSYAPSYTSFISTSASGGLDEAKFEEGRSVMRPISPTELREAIRRHYNPGSAMLPFSKNAVPVSKKSLIG